MISIGRNLNWKSEKVINPFKCTSPRVIVFGLGPKTITRNSNFLAYENVQVTEHLHIYFAIGRRFGWWVLASKGLLNIICC